MEAAELVRRALPGTVFGFTGPRRSGRSTLLSDAADGGQEAEVVWVRGRPNESDSDLLAVAALVGDTRPIDLADQLEAARQRLGTDARLLVDDIDLLDVGSLRLVCAIAGRAAEWEIVVACTGKSMPTDWPGTRVALGPFRPDDAGAAGRLGLSLEQYNAAVTGTGGRPGWLAAAAESSLDTAVATLIERLSAAEREVLAALAWGATPNDDSLAMCLGQAPIDIDAALEQLVIEGVLDQPSATPRPLMAAAIRSATPSALRHRIVDGLSSVHAAGRAVELAGWLADVDDRSGAAAQVFVAAARQEQASAPLHAIEFLESAAQVRSLEPDAGLVLAQAQLAAGMADAALATLHDVADTDRDPQLLGISTAALALDGRSADAVLVIDELEAMDADNVHTQLAPLLRGGQGGDSEATGSPVGTRAAAARFASAAATWMNEGPAAAQRLHDAASAAAALPDLAVWPWHPLEVLAIAACLDGRFDVAEAATAELEAHPMPSAQGDLRRAMVDLRAARLGQVQIPESSGGSRRNAVLALAVEAGLALRRQQSDQLEVLTLDRAVAMLQPDLWSVDALCELALVAARTDGVGEAAALLDPLDALAANHGVDSTVARTLNWTRLLSGVIAEHPETVMGAAERLASGPESLQRRAAAVFVDVYSDVVDLEEIEDTAGALKEAAMAFEASQLTGAAALRSTDEDTTKRLLALSRSLRSERRQAGSGAGTDVDALSDRELDVARLVVLGRTHKEVGAELFISAKTVEHHVARVRRKLGATTRAEMMAAIRDYLDRHDTLD